jgi:outer membrane lipoprotein-sorting protein
MLKYIILLGLILIGKASYPQPVGYQQVKLETDISVKLKDYASKLKSIQSDFRQEKHLEYLDVALESGGKFWFAAPDKVR